MITSLFNGQCLQSNMEKKTSLKLVFSNLKFCDVGLVLSLTQNNSFKIICVLVPLTNFKSYYIVAAINSSQSLSVFPWSSLVPVLAATQCNTTPPPSSPSTPHSAPPISGNGGTVNSGCGNGGPLPVMEPRHSDDMDPPSIEGDNIDLQAVDEDDDVFEPEGPAEPGGLDAAAVAAGKRRTQSLSALQSSKEPHSPQKVLFILCIFYFLFHILSHISLLPRYTCKATVTISQVVHQKLRM